MKDINELYFNTLLEKSKKKEIKSLILSQPERGIDSNILPLAICNDEDLQSIQVQNYGELTEDVCDELFDFTYKVLKMQAGLGTSVKRNDLIKEVEGRENLGSKGTDLYFEVDGKLTSIAEIQLQQAIGLTKQTPYAKVKYSNLVNDETESAVESIWNNKKNDRTYREIFNESEKLEIGESYFQKKMPTLDEMGVLSEERLAPAGHGFVGLLEILDVFNNQATNEVVAIGNGEDLSSTPDLKIINWVVEKNIPIIMITTTKTDADKKGGQISIVKNDGAPDYVTIVEKAQAEASNQLAYFEELGLRVSDRDSLFNTNIVVINKKALKEKFDECLKDTTADLFVQSFAPDVIKNIKEQDGKKFTQLESALGSVVLNLDQFFRKTYNSSVVSFLNLSAVEREMFFMPIKKREDYEAIKSQFYVDPETYRLKRTNESK